MSFEVKQRIVYVSTRTNKADDDDTDLYVGSTSKPLGKRLCEHRCDAIRVGNENNRSYKRMRGIGPGNWKILPLLSRTCDIKTIRELERKWNGVYLSGMKKRFKNTMQTGIKRTKKRFNNGMQIITKRISKWFCTNKQVTANLTCKIRYIIVMYVISRLDTGRI